MMADRFYKGKAAQERIDACLGACSEVSNEDLRQLTARGGLAALLEAAQQALPLLLRDRTSLFESAVTPSTGKVEDQEDREWIAEYDAVIGMLRAVLPQTGESEAPATDHANVSPLSDDEAERTGYPNPGAVSDGERLARIYEITRRADHAEHYGLAELDRDFKEIRGLAKREDGG